MTTFEKTAANFFFNMYLLFTCTPENKLDIDMKIALIVTTE